MKYLSAAFKYLTIFRYLTAAEPALAAVGGGAIFFPLVGLVFGSALVLLNYLLAPYLAPEILTTTLISVLLMLSGGLHLDGLRRMFATWAAEPSVPSGGANDALGFAAILLVILFKIAAADSMDEKLAVSLLLTPVLARWTLVVFLYGFEHQFDEAPRRIAERIRLWHLLLATLATLALAVYFLGRKGLWIGFLLSLFVLLIRSLQYRRHGVLTRDHASAIVELSEALSLILLASL